MFSVSIAPGTGTFEVCESDSLVMSGRVFQPQEPVLQVTLSELTPRTLMLTVVF